MFYKTRIKYASKFGKLEHNTSRVLFVFLLISYVVYYFKFYSLLNWFLLLDIVLWLVYWGSHRIEKKLYPKNFRF